MLGYKFTNHNNKDKTSLSNKFEAKPFREPKKRSFVKFFFLIIFFVIGLTLLIFAQAIAPYEIVDEIKTNSINPNFEEKLVIARSNIPNQEFKDDIFEISKKSIYFKRVVQLYQATDRKGEVAIWSEEINRYTPPGLFSILSNEQKIDSIMFGKFSLSKELYDKLLKKERLVVTQKIYEDLGDLVQQTFKLVDGVLYFGLNPESPQIGDFKVSFEYVDGGDFTILATQKSNSLVANNNEKGSVAKVLKGNVYYATILENVKLSKQKNHLLTIRIIGIVFILIGFVILFISKLPKRERKVKEIKTTKKPKKIKKTKPINSEDKKTKIKKILKKKSLKPKKPKIKKNLPEVNVEEDNFPIDTVVIDENRILNIQTNKEDKEIDFSLDSQSLDHLNDSFEMPEGVEIIGIDNLDFSPSLEKNNNISDEIEKTEKIDNEKQDTSDNNSLLGHSFLDVAQLEDFQAEKLSPEVTKPEDTEKDNQKNISLSKSFKYDSDDIIDKDEQIKFEDDKPMFEIPKGQFEDL